MWEKVKHLLNSQKNTHQRKEYSQIGKKIPKYKDDINNKIERKPSVKEVN